MNRKILALNLGLLVLLGTLAWMLRAQWRETRARELAALSRPPRGKALLPPPSPVPPPPAPAYYGQMALSDPVAFLGVDRSGQKGFHVGDKVGPFKLVAFNRDT